MYNKKKNPSNPPDPCSLHYQQKVLWENAYAEKRDVFGKEPSRFAKRCIDLIVTSPAKMLDIGCGEGRDSVFFANQGYTVTGIDFSENAILHAREQYSSITGLDFSVCDISLDPLPYRSSSFQVVYSHLGLHYFDDQTTDKVFKEIRRVLAPQGVLAFNVKSVKDYKYNEGTRIEDNYYISNNHARHFFDKEYTLKKLAKYSVVSISESRYLFQEGISDFIECVCKKEA